MEELTVQSISFFVMIGLNLLATILAWAEYSSNRFYFLKLVAIAQSSAFVWHWVNLGLTLSPPNSFTLGLSSFFMFCGGLYFLSASMNDKAPAEKWLQITIGTFAALLLITNYFSLPGSNVFLLLSAVVYFLTPLAALKYFSLKSRWFIAVLELFVAIAIVLSVVLLGSPYQDIGGILYIFNAMLVPMLTVVFIIVSVRLSRQEIEKTERDYRVFFDSINEVFFQLDRQGVIQKISPSITQFGITQNEFLDKKLTDYFVDGEQFGAILEEAASCGESFEFQTSLKSESSITDCEIVCSPISEKSGEELHFAGALRNTHERNLLEKQFIDSQRRESLGLLAGGIAHDFNNLLHGIVGHTELILKSKSINPESQAASLNAILGAATSAGMLCRQLLQYTGKGIQNLEYFDIGDSLREVVEILKPSHSKNIEIELNIAASKASVRGDKSQVGQVFLNLVKNAMDAVGDSGHIQVSTEERYMDAANLKPFGTAGVSPGDYFLVTVQDDGAGIDASLQSQIFDPFFSTKNDGHGLGLAAITGILKNHKGGISLHSVKGQGAKFTVIIPLLYNVEAQPRPVSKSPSGSNKHILLVEDDVVVRCVAATILKQAGYRVQEARDGVHALQKYEDTKEPFDMLVTDIKMPNLDGISLARKLNKIDPDLPIILTTGYADVSGELTSSESVMFSFVRKPYQSDEFLAAVKAFSS